MTRLYGPHRPEDNQTGYITHWHNSKTSERVQVPLSPELARQRQQLNDLAARPA